MQTEIKSDFHLGKIVLSEPKAFWFESIFLGIEDKIGIWFNEHLYIPIIIGIVYYCVICFLQKYMLHRKPYELRTALFIWNLFLATFSIFASIRVVPAVTNLLYTYGFYISNCHSYGYRGVTGFYGLVFVLSKPLELGDTIFILLRKQRLIFLHWYHHITVMIYCWWTFSMQMAPARWFYANNFLVHSIMYAYYALRAARVPVPGVAARLITSLQIVQMVVGQLVLMHAAAARLFQSAFCSASWPSIGFGMAMYSSYMVLFCKFFYESYVLGLHRAVASKPPQQTKEHTGSLPESEHPQIANQDGVEVRPRKPAANGALKSHN